MSQKEKIEKLIKKLPNIDPAAKHSWINQLQNASPEKISKIEEILKNIYQKLIANEKQYKSELSKLQREEIIPIIHGIELKQRSSNKQKIQDILSKL